MAQCSELGRSCRLADQSISLLLVYSEILRLPCWIPSWTGLFYLRARGSFTESVGSRQRSQPLQFRSDQSQSVNLDRVQPMVNPNTVAPVPLEDKHGDGSSTPPALPQTERGSGVSTRLATLKRGGENASGMLESPRIPIPSICVRDFSMCRSIRHECRSYY